MSNLQGRKKNKGVKKMAVLTAKCGKAFVVAPEKSKEFLENKRKNSNDDIINKELLSKITIKIKDNNGKA